MPTYKIVNSEQLDADLKVVGDAIRSKSGTTASLEFPNEMKTAIESIEAEETPTQEKTLDVTENGTYEVTADEGYLLSKATVNVEVASSGGGENKFAKLVDRSIEGEIIEADLQGVTNIGDYSFYKCPSITSVTIPNSVTSIGAQAFSYCTGLASVTMSDSITQIGNGGFSNCSSLTSIKLSNNLITISDNMFANCSSLTNVEIPNSVITIGNSMFSGSVPIQSLIIPDSVTTIGDSMFYKNRTIKNVTIGSGITSIGNSMFYDNFQSKIVTIRATTPPTIKSGTFANTPQTFIVPAASVEAYKAATNWSQYASKIVASEEF